MKRYIQYEPFNIYRFDTSQWQHPVHNHIYFEIIFIRNGTGRHHINGNTFQYTSDDVFLLGPEDYHSFEIETHTSFCYIRFTETFLKDHDMPISSNWLRSIEFLMSKSYLQTGSIVSDKKEKELLHHLLIVLLHEYDHKECTSYDQVINGTMLGVLSILARNMIHTHTPSLHGNKSSTLIESMWHFINQHIHEPDKLRIEQLAKQFNYSPSYLSIFFKKKTGESLQQYILKHRLKMVENRLLLSEKSISEITHEFGFTDESHLNKLFKKYSRMTPGEFRHRNLISV